MSSLSGHYSDQLCIQRKCNGDPCQSFALSGKSFCHYHGVMGKPAVNIDNKPSGHTYLRPFEDSVSIQNSISDVCEMMLHRRIDPKEASILLYAMQVASINMAQMNGVKGPLKQNGKKNGHKSNAEPSAEIPSTEPSATHASPATSPSSPNSLPPGTIQASEQASEQRET